MASPQLENGYTRIANELLEAICAANLGGTQTAIVLVLIRETYGYHRKSVRMSLAKLAEKTGRSKRTIGKEVEGLIRLNIIVEIDSAAFDRAREIGLNKDHATWIVRVSAPVEENGTVEEKGTPTVEVLDTPTVEEKGTPSICIKKGLKKHSKERPVFEVPDRLKSVSGFCEAWEEWCNYRRESKKPLKPSSARAQLKFLEKQDNPVECIETSIRNSWQGIFESHNGATNGRTRNTNKPTDPDLGKRNYVPDHDEYQRLAEDLHRERVQRLARIEAKRSAGTDGADASA